MTTREFYEKIGEDYDEVLRRFGSDEIVRRFVLKFEKDGSFPSLDGTLKKGDVENAFCFAHTLKGIALNLGFKKLGALSGEVTTLLRSKDLEKAVAAFPALKEEYESVVFCIASLKIEE